MLYEGVELGGIGNLPVMVHKRGIKIGQSCYAKGVELVI